MKKGATKKKINTDIVIGGKPVALGKTKQINLIVAKLPSRTRIDIPVIVSRSKKPGPTLLLMAGLHGDEINGVEILRRILDKKDHMPLKGTVICVPILNIFGFLHFSRDVPDGKDVNRSFPGTKIGSLASRVAHKLMTEIIPHIDCGVDFHTGGASRTNYPQIRCQLSNKTNAKLADAFHAPITLDSKIITKSLRHATTKAGKNILVYEAGEALRFDEYAIRQGIRGTFRLMQHLGMRKNVPNARHNSIIIKKSKWIRARASGLFHSSVESGEKISISQEIGYLTGPFADFKLQLKSPIEGYVIGLNNAPVVNRGDALFHIGYL